MNDRRPEWQSEKVQERMVSEVSYFLKSLTSNAQHGAQPGRAKTVRRSSFSLDARQPGPLEYQGPETKSSKGVIQ